MKKLLSLILSTFVCVLALAKITPLEWEVGYVKLPDGVLASDFYGQSKNISPDGIVDKYAPKEFYPSEVPGAVQLDVMKALKMPPFWYADNVDKNYWLEDCFYTYKTIFKKVDLEKNKRLYFVSKGIDYKFDIVFNGKKIHSQEGMFTYVNLDLTNLLKDENELKVFIYPAPKKAGYKPSTKIRYVETVRDHASQVAKPPVSYGWDWHPRAVPLGIWDETGLEVRDNSHIDDAHLQYELSDDFKSANLNLLLEGKNLVGKKYFWSLTDANGKVALSNSGDIKENVSEIPQPDFKNPRLWWTHDHSEPHLYTWNLSLLDSDGKEIQKLSSNVGFKRIRLVTNTGAWTEQRTFPMTRSSPPAQFELNGRRIFAKGSNWVNPEVYWGTITDKRYETLVRYGKEMNFNIFRVWGGAIVNKESFFDYCDKLGILVWQDFPLACNNYWDDKYYISILKQEATSIVKRGRKHACLALWNGGNELFNSWSGMTEQSHALRMLNGVCFDLDKLTPFNNSAPVMGMKHGPYFFKYRCSPKGSTSMNTLKGKKATTYTEFGVQGMCDAETIKEVIPADELWPIKETPSWLAHRGFRPIRYGWVCQDEIDEFCGKSESLEEFVEKSQFLQAQGYKAMFEEARRQKPYCSMAINWDYNDAWKTIGGNAIIGYPDIRKQSFYAIKQALRPFLVSARFDKINWKPSETMTAELALLNDSFSKHDAGVVSIYLECDGKREKVGLWKAPVAMPNENVEGPRVEIKLPEKIESNRFKLLFESSKNPEYNSEYSFTVDRK